MIDAHQHFWQLGQNDCRWPPPELAAIHRDFMPEDLAPLLASAGVTGTVLVQSQPSDADTDFICKLAERTESVKAVVGWADLEAVSAPAWINGLATRKKLRGLRAMVQDLPADAFDSENLGYATDAIMDNELTFDALVRPRHLDNLYWFAESYRELSIVIDHAGKPDIAAGELEPWRTSMRALASLPNVYCKLSGLVTEARPGCEPSDLQPYVKSVIEYFGSQRTMWGSDWPVVNLASNYSAWLETARTLTAALKRADLDAIFGGTASRFYNLKV